MPDKQFSSFEDENKRLFTLLFRHSVYLEGVKAGYARDYQLGLKELYKQFAAFMGASRYQTLDGYSKAELEQFIYKFQRAQQSFYSRYTKTLVGKLRDFLDTDVDVTRAMYKNVTGLYPHEVSDGLPQQISTADYNSLSTLIQSNYIQYDKGGYVLEDQNDYTGNTPALGPAVTVGDKDSNDRLWSIITNAPVPANGMLLEVLINAWANSVMNDTTAEIRKGYANKATTISVLDAIIGNPKKGFTDGIFAKALAKHNALTSTLTQHVTSMQQSATASVFYSRYQWVAILDNRTTVICQSRNGTVYVYGKGPLPPAHWYCRSSAVPLAGDQPVHNIPQDYVSALRQQPEDVLNDLVGKEIAKQIMDGTISEGSFSFIGTVQPLTLEQFADKLPYILGE
jgi:SPP1 gp7 family putative phage head morphogenesis protein